MKKEGMNLKKVRKELKKFFAAKKLTFKIEDEDRRVVCTNSLGLKPYDDDIFARFEYYENGTAAFNFTFDHLTINEQTLRMVNDFNERSPWLYAYVDTAKGYMRICHPSLLLHEEDVCTYTERVMSVLASRDLEAVLAPLCILTEGDSN